MWLQHKVVLPSIMSYWAKMFYAQENPVAKQLDDMKKENSEYFKRIEGKLDKLSTKDNQ